MCGVHTTFGNLSKCADNAKGYHNSTGVGYPEQSEQSAQDTCSRRIHSTAMILNRIHTTHRYSDIRRLEPMSQFDRRAMHVQKNFLEVRGSLYCHYAHLQRHTR